MEDTKLDRLNELFERAVDNKVSFAENCELMSLYSKFVNEGREPNLLNTAPIRNNDSLHNRQQASISY